MISRTINQIHFEDLEPHRFEDLIRQLIYNFKNWASLEATGKLGSDDGIDIRGYEKIFTNQEETEDLEEFEEKIWFIQCKREKVITPKKMEKIIDESFISGVPDCYILAAACDFSKKTRDIFREKMIKYRIKEFYLWGKTDLEDMLFQEKNDSILFTFFGFSIYLKQKDNSSKIKKKIAIKNKLKIFIGCDREFDEAVITGIDDIDYIDNISDYYSIENIFHENGLIIIIGRYPAYIDFQKKEYDYDIDENFGKPINILIEDENKRNISISVPENKKGVVEVYGILPYDEILEVDKYGDFRTDGRPIIVVKDKKVIQKDMKLVLVDNFNNQLLISEYKKINYFKKKKENPQNI